ncbi:hypothetical protein [uncultured Massilia sp.]|uniref:hypothetical protein n=1 Tax=uncultured Massilia sp. TaxID=169973 RepID=UPI00258C8ACC|nr:hypothetical protein [uncultured Massilia sp.]
MFQLTEHKAKLSNVNPRAELHGDQPKPAVDLMIEAACPSTVLNSFHPELRGMLYKKDENPDLVERVEEGDAITALRMPKLGALKWDHEGTGYTVTVDYGMGGDSNIVLGDVKVDKFKFTAQEGGTVTVQCRIIAHPDEKVIGPLCNFIQRDIVISITPPEPTTVQELFGEAA